MESLVVDLFAHTSIPFFASLSSESLAELAKSSQLRTLKRDQRIFSQGERADEVFILSAGLVKLTRLAQKQPPAPPPLRGKVTLKQIRMQAQKTQPRESLLWLMGPGEMFGELSLFDEGARSTTAVAMTASQIIAIEGETLRRMMSERRDVTDAMLRQLAQRLRRSDDHTNGFVLSDVAGRVAHQLLSLADRFGIETGEGVHVVHHLTQAEMAQFVGATRETVNKTLTDLERRDVIRVETGAVMIKDRDRLAARLE